METNQSPKSRLVALLFCFFLGGLGIHRFYVGKIGTGILTIITIFGFFGIWPLIDLIMIAAGLFKDKEGRPLIKWVTMDIEIDRITGILIRKFISIWLKFFGVVTLICAAYGSFSLFVIAYKYLRKRYLFHFYEYALGYSWAIFSGILILFVGIIFLMLYWHRANKINKLLADETHLSIIPVMVILICLVGEISFVFFAWLCVEIFISLDYRLLYPDIVDDIVSLSSSGMIKLFVRLIGLENGFVREIILLIRYIFICGGSLIVSYYIAEQISLFVDIATNVKKIEKTTPIK